MTSTLTIRKKNLCQKNMKVEESSHEKIRKCQKEGSLRGINVLPLLHLQHEVFSTFQDDTLYSKIIILLP